MRFLFKAKDGGPESKVTGYWLFESKRFGSVALLKFDYGSREAYHTHAFNALSWVLYGGITEHLRYGVWAYMPPRLKPYYTPKERYHKVAGVANTTWALTFRGPWDKTWKEFIPAEDKEITLTNGRKVVND
ncbi:MAG: hypothetical protein ACXW1D_00040 [Halobacteriota archaeon]